MDANDRSVGRESVDGRARSSSRPRSVASSSIQSITAIPIDDAYGWLFPSPARHTRVFLTRYFSRLEVSRGASIDAHRSIDIDRYRSRASMCASMNTSTRASIGVETRRMSTTAAATGVHVASIGSSRAHGTATRGDASVRARVVVVVFVVVVVVERESRRDANGGDARAVRRRAWGRGRW